MKNLKLPIIFVSALLAVIFITSLVSSGSVAGFLFYDSTNERSLEIEFGEDVGIIVTGDSVFESSMTINVDLINIDNGAIVSNLIYVTTPLEHFDTNYTFDEGIYENPGDYLIKLVVTGASGYSDTEELILTVKEISAGNNPPIITSSPITQIDENEEYSYQVIASDEDNDVLNYSLIIKTNSPNFLSIDSEGLITGTAPEVSEDTTFGVGVKVSDGKDSVTQTYNLLVRNVEVPEENHPPMITFIPDQEIDENTAYQFQVIATDVDGDVPSYSLNDSPSFLSIDSEGLITGTAPEVDQDTQFTITVSVSDEKDVATQSYQLTVKNVEGPNNPPMITSSPITQVNENEEYIYQVDASDDDGDVLSYSLIIKTNSPNFLSIDSEGLITGTAPEVNEDTTFGVGVKVSDGKDSVTQTYNLLVKNVEGPIDTEAPIIEIISPENITYNISEILFSISTNEDATAQFSLNNGANQSMVTTDNRIFSFDGDLADGFYTIVFFAQDAAGNIGTAQVSFTVDTSKEDESKDRKRRKKRSGLQIFEEDLTEGPIKRIPIIEPEEIKQVLKTKKDGTGLIWILIVFFLIMSILLLAAIMVLTKRKSDRKL